MGGYGGGDPQAHSFDEAWPAFGLARPPAFQDYERRSAQLLEVIGPLLDDASYASLRQGLASGDGQAVAAVLDRLVCDDAIRGTATAMIERFMTSFRIR